MQQRLFNNYSFLHFDHYLEDNKLSSEGIKHFQRHIKEFYQKYGREFDWRKTTDPYDILVSEIMLQQTQTQRVAEKFLPFITQFPTFEALAAASIRDVLLAWQGLGYNRRALALQASAQRIVSEFNGIMPQDPVILQTFKGIGPNTAGSICAFAFNKPTIFIETNVRSIFIYSFFHQGDMVHDKELLILIAQTIDTQNPREWYYALMDYGVALKKHVKNPNHRSKHYSIQSRFEGSERQIRGMILRALTAHTALSFELLCALIDREPQRIDNNLRDLIVEGFVRADKNIYYIA
jgi:A/G-specific adenine glycosylase